MPSPLHYILADPKWLHHVIHHMGIMMNRDNVQVIPYAETEQFRESNGEYVTMYLEDGDLHIYLDGNNEPWAYLYCSDSGEDPIFTERHEITTCPITGA